MKFTLGVSLKFQVPGRHSPENLIQCVDGAHAMAFLTRALNDSDAGGRQIAN